MSYIGNQPVLNTSEFREEFAVTSTQTVFNTGGFTASSDSATLEVLRNGVLLGTADYTLGSDASTVTLANAAVSGDIIVIKGRRELTNGVQVTERRHEHTIASGETTVTFPYPLTVSQTDVYLNGVKLGSSDFSINSSTRVVSFTSNPAVGDLVAIVSREPALTANSSLPVVDAAGNNVLSESGGVVTLSDVVGNGIITTATSLRLNSDITTNLEIPAYTKWTNANTIANGGSLGNQVTVGTGIDAPNGYFVFPSTGIYLIHAFAHLQNTSGDSSLTLNVYYWNGSTSNIIFSLNNRDGGDVGVSSAMQIVTISDITHNIYPKSDTLNSGSVITGNAGQHMTGFTFLKIGS
jgi:hypothetical protein